MNSAQEQTENSKKLLIQMIERGMITLEDIKMDLDENKMQRMLGGQKPETKQTEGSESPEVAKRVKKFKPNTPKKSEKLEIDDIFSAAAGQNLDAGSVEGSEEGGILENFDVDKVNRGNGMMMSAIVGFEDQRLSGNLTIEQAFKGRLIPVRRLSGEGSLLFGGEQDGQNREKRQNEGVWESGQNGRKNDAQGGGGVSGAVIEEEFEIDMDELDAMVEESLRNQELEKQQKLIKKAENQAEKAPIESANIKEHQIEEPGASEDQKSMKIEEPENEPKTKKTGKKAPNSLHLIPIESLQSTKTDQPAQNTKNAPEIEIYSKSKLTQTRAFQSNQPSESSSKHEETTLDFPKILSKFSILHKPLKPTFGDKYELTATKATDNDGDEVEGLEFYWFDMAMSSSNKEKRYIMDKLHIFGKVKAVNKKHQKRAQRGSRPPPETPSNASTRKIDQKIQKTQIFEEYVSACLTVNILERTLYIAKKKASTIQKCEAEVKNRLEKFGFLPEIKIRKVTKKYTFELDLPSGDIECIELRYPVKYGSLRLPFQGQHYKGVFGDSMSVIESTILEKELMGPGWLLVRDFRRLSRAGERYSWCKVDIEIDSIDEFDRWDSTQNEAPRLKVLGLELGMSNKASNPRFSEVRAACLVETEIGFGGRNGVDDGVGGVEVAPLMMLVDEVGEFKAIPDRFEQLKAEFKYEKFDQKMEELDEAEDNEGAMELEDAKNSPSNEPDSSKSPKSPKNPKLGKIRGEPQISLCSSESQCLRLILQKLSILDPDIIIGHDLKASALEILVDRLTFKKISFSDKLSRLRRPQDVMTFSAKKRGLQKVRSFTIGRMILDTFSTISEFWREREYTLAHLCHKHLQNCLGEPPRQPRSASTPLQTLLLRNLYSLLLNQNLGLAELTQQLSTLSGCLWHTSLNGTKSSRNEMLIMQKFNEFNYILPDKFKYSFSEKKKKKMKENSYQGGLVFEPKKGLHEDFVLALDFNSLYPSIIREFKICFTTVRREKVKIGFYTNRDNYEHVYLNIDEVADSHRTVVVHRRNQGVNLLPKIVKNLIDRRNEIKAEMTSEEDSGRRRVLDVKQKAYKVISNSIYGCLGSQFSRFYSRSMAELVTFYGRELLRRSAAEAQKMGCDIVYGDTDSVFVNTKTKNLNKAINLGLRLKKAINRFSKSKILEISLESVYRRLLLTHKKRYAGLALGNLKEVVKTPFAEPVYQLEVKGMDVVRREWCGVSRELGVRVLELALGVGEDEDGVGDVGEEKLLGSIFGEIGRVREMLDRYGEAQEPSLDLNNALRGAGDDEKSKIGKNRFFEEKISLDKFVLYQRLNKSLDQYTSNSIAFVNVARRLMIRKKLRNSQLVGKVIPYLICRGPPGTDLPIYRRAHHPEEFLESQKTPKKLEIDIEWYKDSQLLKPISRLLEHVKGVSKDKLKYLLGLGGVRYAQNAQNEQNGENQILGVSDVSLLSNLAKTTKASSDEHFRLFGTAPGRRHDFFYDRYSKLYKPISWLQTDPKHPSAPPTRYFLNQKTAQSPAFNSLTPKFLKNRFSSILSQIVQNYYISQPFFCEACDEQVEGFSMVSEVNDICPECENELTEGGPSARLVNGNLYYLEQLFDRLSQNMGVRTELKEVMRGEILGVLREMRGGSGFEKVGLGSAFEASVVVSGAGAGSGGVKVGGMRLVNGRRRKNLKRYKVIGEGFDRLLTE